MSATVDVATGIRPFEVAIAENQIDEMRRRIAATRWPSAELVEDRSQGVRLATLRALARYWETDYDWRRAEARLNALPQFTTEIDGVEIHFIHVQVAARGRAAADHDPRMARLRYRAARGGRPADRPDRPRRLGRRTPSTSSCRHCPATGSRASRRSSAGSPAASPAPGRT